MRKIYFIITILLFIPSNCFSNEKVNTPLQDFPKKNTPLQPSPKLNVKDRDSQFINYSILIEEDYDTIMFIYRYKNSKETAEILSDYKYFLQAHTFPKSSTMSYVLPSNLVIKNEKNFKNLMQEKYLLNNFNYQFKDPDPGNHLSSLTFEVPKEIKDFVRKKEDFYFTTIVYQKLWYGMRFSLVNNEQDLLNIAKENTSTFCKIIEKSKKINSPINEIPNINLSKLVKNHKLRCR